MAIPEPLSRPAPESFEPATTQRRAFPDRRLLAAAILLIAGIALVLLGWYGAAHTTIITEQIPYLISGGLLGVALIIVSAILAFAVATETQAKALREDLARALNALSYTGRPSNVTPARVLIVASGRTYHVPGCPIPEGKDVRTMPLAEAESTGFAACKLCASAS